MGALTTQLAAGEVVEVVEGKGVGGAMGYRAGLGGACPADPVRRDEMLKGRHDLLLVWKLDALW
jgi:hypothetical protein